MKVQLVKYYLFLPDYGTITRGFAFGIENAIKKSIKKANSFLIDSIGEENLFKHRSYRIYTLIVQLSFKNPLKIEICQNLMRSQIQISLNPDNLFKI